jgi:hypothetical protein
MEMVVRHALLSDVCRAPFETQGTLQVLLAPVVLRGGDPTQKEERPGTKEH